MHSRKYRGVRSRHTIEPLSGLVGHKLRADFCKFAGHTQSSPLAAMDLIPPSFETSRLCALFSFGSSEGGQIVAGRSPDVGQAQRPYRQ